eukprot:1177137-Prorocentrum_minimum.AAC.1
MPKMGAFALQLHILTLGDVLPDAHHPNHVPLVVPTGGGVQQKVHALAVLREEGELKVHRPFPLHERGTRSAECHVESAMHHPDARAIHIGGGLPGRQPEPTQLAQSTSSTQSPRAARTTWGQPAVARRGSLTWDANGRGDSRARPLHSIRASLRPRRAVPFPTAKCGGFAGVRRTKRGTVVGQGGDTEDPRALARGFRLGGIGTLASR